MPESALRQISETETLAEARAWVSGALPASAGTIALIGAGLGYALDFVEERQPPIRVVVFEPDPVAAAAMLARRDWSGWLGADRLAVLTGPDYAGLPEIARRFPDLHRAPTLVHPRLADANGAAVEAARAALSRATFQTSANESARRASAGRYLLHTLANAPRIARESNVAALANLCEGLPAIIAAAGPSLDMNLHDLRTLRDRAVLIACDTAARPLLWAGLDPDVVVAADPSRANAGHLSSLPPTRAWLASEGSLHPSAFAHFDRRTFFFTVSNHQPWPWLRSLGVDRATLATWGSVATSAFSLAVSMGCDPIVLVGADFAFTGYRPYCRGTSFESQWATWAAGGADYPAIWKALVDHWPAMTQPDLHGQLTRTASHLVSFRDWIVERARASGRQVVNATGAGLLFGAGIEQGALTTVFASRPSLPGDALTVLFRAAHRSHQGDPVTLLQGIDSIAGETDSAVRQAWRTFTDSHVSDSAIDGALNSAEYQAWRLASRSPVFSQEVL